MLFWLANAAPAGAVVFGEAELSEADRQKLDASFEPCVRKRKGPFTRNFCACANGKRELVTTSGGQIAPLCTGSHILICAAWRTPEAEALTDYGIYLANLFSRDLLEWDDFPDHHDLVRGYVLEKFFIDTHPSHKLATVRTLRGVAGAEYEARDAPIFFERYIDSDAFREPRHYLLAYELQRRYYVRNDQGQIHRVRNLASAIQEAQPEFKPLRDAVHNQITAALLPTLAAYRERQPAGEVRNQIDELIREIDKLTSLDESALEAQLGEIEDVETRELLISALRPEGDDPITALGGLAGVTVLARRHVEAKRGTPADRRRQIDAAITASALLQQRASELLDGGGLSLGQYVDLLIVLADAGYGAGLLRERERAEAVANLRALRERPKVERAELERRLDAAERVAEWAQGGTGHAFAEVQAPWAHVLPATRLIGDDILRGSPILVYARALQELEDRIPGRQRIVHELFGAEVSGDVRALNPGLAVGVLRVSPRPGEYERGDVVALADTPPDLDPAAGILTQGEGNVVSHVQLLARALGIPNVVLGPAAFQRVAEHDGKPVLLVVTPGGRVIAKEVAAMSDADRQAVAEFTRNDARSGDGALAAESRKLHIDVDRLDLSAKTALDLAELSRADSGVRVGPKAAYLGTLKRLFPDKVSRGVVVPFGAYYDHYQRASVQVPDGLSGVAEPGTPLPEFVEKTYATFFDEMLGRSTEAELSEWIRPRLAVIRHSIQSAPLSPELRESIRRELERQRLLRPTGETPGLFVRSDTNVEDLEDFNGAGLNLTLFNLVGLEEIHAGLKEVWASPFTYRSFSWRQTLIDQPLWVLASVVILESIPSEKSGVLVTADLRGGRRDAMLVATSEGVGGAVDGTPAETLLWTPEGVELVTLFKSPSRRLLDAQGGSRVVPATGGEAVLTPDELEQLIAAARTLQKRLEPAVDKAGRPRPWDVEYGFADGRLWLFQVRPFIGNEELDNVPALAGYELPKQRTSASVRMDAVSP